LHSIIPGEVQVRPAPIAWVHPGVAGSLGDRCGASPRFLIPWLAIQCHQVRAMLPIWSGLPEPESP